ncbi:hypothetical protein V8G54_007100 [Vigna mungo]|uniref:Uncharacterized protein n=1 Tax=Vigna mungo TaxID=3915 RepID=A0AAQ3P4R2_VIGMU
MEYEKFGIKRSSRVAWSSCMPIRFSKLDMQEGLTRRIMAVRSRPNKNFVWTRPFCIGSKPSISSSRIFWSSSDSGDPMAPCVSRVLDSPETWRRFSIGRYVLA